MLNEHGRMLIGHAVAITSLDEKMSRGFAELNTGMRQIVGLLGGAP